MRSVGKLGNIRKKCCRVNFDVATMKSAAIAAVNTPVNQPTRLTSVVHDGSSTKYESWRVYTTRADSRWRGHQKLFACNTSKPASLVSRSDDVQYSIRSSRLATPGA